VLGQIGQELDRQAFPRVADGGFIVLSEPAVPSTLVRDGESSWTRKAERIRSRTAARGPRMARGDPRITDGRSSAQIFKCDTKQK